MDTFNITPLDCFDSYIYGPFNTKLNGKYGVVVIEAPELTEYKIIKESEVYDPSANACKKRYTSYVTTDDLGEIVKVWFDFEGYMRREDLF